MYDLPRRWVKPTRQRDAARGELTVLHQDSVRAGLLEEMPRLPTHETHFDRAFFKLSTSSISFLSVFSRS
jgi:hypothetical protein